MSEMIEKVGKAIAAADGEDYYEDRRYYDARARAAIEAMLSTLPAPLRDSVREAIELTGAHADHR